MGEGAAARRWRKPRRRLPMAKKKPQILIIPQCTNPADTDDHTQHQTTNDFTKYHHPCAGYPAPSV